MAVTLLASATGAPGVTTTAVGLSLCWPGETLLVDADRDCAQAVLAGYLRGANPSGCGLVPLAQAHRHGGSLTAELLRRSLPLTAGSPRRRFLPGFTRPATVAMLAPMWAGLTASFAEISRSGVEVLIDAGRIGALGLPPALLAGADRLIVLTRSHLRGLAALRLVLPAVAEAADEAGVGLGLVLIDPDAPYSAREVTAHFAVPVLGVLARHPASAAQYSDGLAYRHRHDPLTRDLAALAGRLRRSDPLHSASAVALAYAGEAGR